MDKTGITLMCAVVIALTSVAGLMQLNDGWDEMHVPVTDTISKKHMGWAGGGGYPDPTTGERQHGEIFNAPTNYFTSWRSDGTSQTIIVLGKTWVSGDDWFACTVGKKRYQFWIHDGVDEDGESIDGDKGWDRLMVTGGWMDGTFEEEGNEVTFDLPGLHIGKEFLAPHYDFQLDGLYPDGSTIMVRFMAYCEPILGVGGGWSTVAIDEARLIQGDGILNWVHDTYMLGVDDYAYLEYFVPAVDTVGPTGPIQIYSVHVMNRNTGNQVLEETLYKKSGTFKIKLTDDMVEKAGLNELRARLWTNLFQKDVTHVGVNILGGLIDPADEPMVFPDDYPKLNSISLDKGKYAPGDIATLTIDATQGRYPIKEYSILCEIEGTEVADIRTQQSVYQFQVNINGIAECEVIVYDINGNSSPRHDVIASVRDLTLEDWCKLHPTDPACIIDKDKKGMDWLEGLIIALLVAALLIIVAFEFWGLSQVGLDLRITLAVIGITLLVGMILIAMKMQEYMAT